MRTAIFGGSFNPLHIGHLCIAEELIHAIPCDRVLFVPARIPPHKDLIDDPGAVLRLEMLKASLDADHRFSVSDCEIVRGGVSYSIDTIRYLKAEGMIESCPFLVIGNDLVEGFPSWKDSASLLDECRIVIVRRDASLRPAPSFPHIQLDNDIFPVSSSLVRSRIASGGAWKFLVPAETRRAIEKHGLYGFR